MIKAKNYKIYSSVVLLLLFVVGFSQLYVKEGVILQDLHSSIALKKQTYGTVYVTQPILLTHFESSLTFGKIIYTYTSKKEKKIGERENKRTANYISTQLPKPRRLITDTKKIGTSNPISFFSPLGGNTKVALTESRQSETKEIILHKAYQKIGKHIGKNILLLTHNYYNYFKNTTFYTRPPPSS